MNISYRQLQTELKTLRKEGLVDSELKLNGSKEILEQTYQKYLSHQERKQTFNNPLLVIWVFILVLALALGLVYLGLELILFSLRSLFKLERLVDLQTEANLLLNTVITSSKNYKLSTTEVSNLKSNTWIWQDNWCQPKNFHLNLGE